MNDKLFRSKLDEMKHFLSAGKLADAWKLAGLYTDEELFQSNESTRAEWIKLRQEILQKMINELKQKP